jgi:hypothetical protein
MNLKDNRVKISGYEITNANDDVPQMYVDGFNGLLISPINSRITFYQVTGINSELKKERRKLHMTLVIPTVSMIDFCRKYLAEATSQAGQSSEPGNASPSTENKKESPH